MPFIRDQLIPGKAFWLDYTATCYDLEFSSETGLKLDVSRLGKQQWKLWDHPRPCSWLVWLGASPVVLFKQTSQTEMPSALLIGSQWLPPPRPEYRQKRQAPTFSHSSQLVATLSSGLKGAINHNKRWKGLWIGKAAALLRHCTVCVGPSVSYKADTL